MHRHELHGIDERRVDELDLSLLSQRGENSTFRFARGRKVRLKVDFQPDIRLRTTNGWTFKSRPFNSTNYVFTRCLAGTRRRGTSSGFGLGGFRLTNSRGQLRLLSTHRQTGDSEYGRQSDDCEQPSTTV